MFTGSHIVMVSQRGLPTVVNVNSLAYPEIVQSGNYSPATEELMSKREADELKDELLRDFPGLNE